MSDQGAVDAAVRQDAMRISTAVRAILTAAGLSEGAVERLHRYATRHLPLAERQEGSAFIPPLYALRVARELTVADALAVEFAAVGCLFFAAADLADDCADGDVRRTVGLDINDTCHLLFAQQQGTLALAVSTETRLALAGLFADAGQEMAIGQAADLAGTDALEAAAPLDIAVGKTGGELAAFFAGPAILAGCDPTALRDFGRAFGGLVQVLTDYFDLFLDEESDDWAACKPTVPIRHGMGHPREGAAIRHLIAGDRIGADRRAAGRWHLVQSGVADRFAEVVATLGARMRAAEAVHPGLTCLRAARGELEEWSQGVIDALTEFAADPAPPLRAAAAEVQDAREAAWAFLAADPAFDEATEVHRHGLFGKPVVDGGLFGRALAIDALDGEPVDLTAARAAAFALSDADSWRYYPGHLELPCDSDCIGVMMQIAREPRERAHPAFARGAALLQLAENLDADGLPYTWLADGAGFTRAGIDAVWLGGVCPGATANALVGLWRWGDAGLRDWAAARVGALAERLVEAHDSVFYPAPVVDYMGVRCLLEIGGDAPQIAAAVRAVGDRACARRTASGTLGDTLSTALGAWILARTGRLERPAEVQRALVDAQAADGGWAADPLYLTVPHPVTPWYGSRVVTTAYVLQALRAIEQAG